MGSVVTGILHRTQGFLIVYVLVMGDRGFTIRDLVEERRVRLVIPAFTRKHSQLTNEQVTQMRRIANVRIHVERAIRRLKVFKILSNRANKLSS